jgi:uncharacterized protein (DUF1015 family)
MGEPQYGIVAAASVKEYEAGTSKYMNTRGRQERERILHVDCVGAITAPVFLTYKRRSH